MTFTQELQAAPATPEDRPATYCIQFINFNDSVVPTHVYIGHTKDITTTKNRYQHDLSEGIMYPAELIELHNNPNYYTLITTLELGNLHKGKFKGYTNRAKKQGLTTYSMRLS